MIDTPGEALTSSKDFATSRPSIRIDPPLGNALFVGETVTFQRNGVAREPSAPAVLLGDPARILEEMRSASERDAKRYPSSAPAHVNLALALINEGRSAEAERELELALDADPRNYIALGALARLRIDQGRLPEAERLYALMEGENRSDIAVVMGLAAIALKRGQSEKAKAILRRASSTQKDRGLAEFQLGLAILVGGDASAAIGPLRRATHAQVRLPAFHQALAVAYLQTGQLRRAEMSFRTALALEPTWDAPIRGLAEVLIRERRFEDLVIAGRAYLALRTTDPAAHGLLANAYHESGRPAAALEALRGQFALVRSDQISEQSRVCNNIGVCFAELGQAVEAEQWFERAISRVPGGAPLAHLNLIRLLVEQTSWGRADVLMREYKRLYPLDETAHLLEALVDIGQSRFLDAITGLREVIRGGQGPAVAYALMGGLLTDEQPELEEALDVLTAGASAFPNDTHIANNLAYAFLMNGQPAAARKVLESVRPPTSGPSRVPLEATWGLLYIWEGDLRLGAQRYRKAARLAQELQNPGLVDQVKQKLHLEMARAYGRAGKRDRAIMEARQGLQYRGKIAYLRDLRAIAGETD